MRSVRAFLTVRPDRSRFVRPSVGRDSTDGDDGDGFVQRVPGDAHGPVIQHGLAVHEEPVLVMARGKHHLQKPPAVTTPLHGIGTPVVEIAGQLNGLRLGRVVVEVCRTEGMPWPWDSSHLLFINRIHTQPFPLRFFDWRGPLPRPPNPFTSTRQALEMHGFLLKFLAVHFVRGLLPSNVQ